MDLNALRLTAEEQEVLLGEDFQTAYSGHVAEYQAIADAQLAKALWGVRDWLGSVDDGQPSTPSSKAVLYYGRTLRDMLEAAGIPKEG